MDYANRDFEYSTLRKYLLNGTTPICIDAYHASGVTSFVKKRMHDVFASLFDSNIFYIHVSTEKLLSEALLIHLVQPTYLDKIQKFVDKKSMIRWKFHHFATQLTKVEHTIRLSYIV